MIKRSLGRSEEVALPQLDWHSVEARVDTGAYHCAIHCINYHVDGTDLVVSWTNGRQTRHSQFRKATVKSSFGDLQERYLEGERQAKSLEGEVQAKIAQKVRARLSLDAQAAEILGLGPIQSPAHTSLKSN